MCNVYYNDYMHIAENRMRKHYDAGRNQHSGNETRQASISSSSIAETADQSLGVGE